MNNKSNAKSSLFRTLLIVGGIFIIIVLAYLFVQSRGVGDISGKSKVYFAGTQKITEESKLHMTFPDKMDKESVIESIETSDELEGEVTWEGSTLVFEPDEKLEEGKTYSFRINRDAKYASGTPLNQDMEFKFTVAGPPVVSSNYPLTDATDIDPNTKIHLVFDRPIVPLSAVQGTGAKKYRGDWPVSFTPRINGTWRWLGTTTAEFTPSDELIPATKYTVNVPKGIVSVIGDKTTEDFSWEFETIRPKVVTTDPYDHYEFNGPETVVTLTFNQEMDTKLAKESIQFFQVEEKNKRSSIDFDLGYGSNLIDEKEVMTKKKIIITPSQPLPLDSQFEVVVEKGIKGAGGKLGSMEDTILNFYTVGDFEVDQFEFTNHNRIFIEFSNPVDDETLQGNITISPEVEGWEDIKFQTRSWSDNRELNIYPPLKPSTEYTLKLNTEVSDKFGQTLEKDYKEIFTTPPLDPQLNILTQGEFGIFEKISPPVYPFETVNVSRINLEFARIPFEDFLTIRGLKQSSWRYEPILSEHIGFQKFTLTPKNELNTWETSYLEFEKELGRSLISGIYGLRVQAPEYVRSDGTPIIQYSILP